MASENVKIKINEVDTTTPAGAGLQRPGHSIHARGQCLLFIQAFSQPCRHQSNYLPKEPF